MTARVRRWGVAAAAALGLWLAGCGQPPRPPAGEPAARPPAAEVAPVPPMPSVAEPARHWAQYRLRAGQRIAGANAPGVYLDTPPDVLLAVPVLKIDLRADGSIQRIEVLRQPGQARDTTQLAIDAVRRAAPFGSVAHLPRPWSFTESFLFRDDRRFKPRSLD